MSYTISFADVTKPTFTIPVAGIDGPTFSQQHTDLTLYGQNRTEYGQGLDDNFVRLLENFSHPQISANTPNASVISHPIQGQLWFNESTLTLLVYNGATWVPLGGAITYGSVAPSSPLPGALWYNTTSNLLLVWNGSAFIATSNQYLLLNGSSPMTGALNAGGFKVTNAAVPTVATDVTTKGYTDSTYLSVSGGTVTGNLTIGGGANLILSTNSRIAFPYGYYYQINNGGTQEQRAVLSSSNNTYALKIGYESTLGTSGSFIATTTITAGGSLTTSSILASSIAVQSGGTLSAGGNIVSNVANPTAGTNALNLQTGDARYLLLTGGTMTGNLNLGAHTITNVSSLAATSISASSATIPTISTTSLTVGGVAVLNGGAQSGGALNMLNNRINNVANPVVGQDAVNLQHLNSALPVLFYKQAVFASTIWAGGPQTINFVNFHSMGPTASVTATATHSGGNLNQYTITVSGLSATDFSQIEFQMNHCGTGNPTDSISPMPNGYTMSYSGTTLTITAGGFSLFTDYAYFSIRVTNF